MRACRATLALVFGLGMPATAAEPAPARPPTVTLRPARDRYVAGEPIGVVVTLRNPGTAPVGFRFSYPFTFQREFGLIRFDGGRSLHPVPERDLALSGPILAFATEIPAGATWSATVFLQNYLTPFRPGDYQVGYRFTASYRRQGQAHEDDDPLRDTYPSVSAEGSLAIRVTQANPVELDRVLKEQVERLARLAPGPDSWEASAEVFEALGAVDDPAVIPCVGAALAAMGRRQSGFQPGVDALFRNLDRFRGRKSARQVVTGLLRNESPYLRSLALEWLREASVAVDPGLLVALLDSALEQGEPAHSELLYLQQVPIPSTPALQERVLRCLGPGPVPDTDAYALETLARWNAPLDARVRKALGRLSDSLKKGRSPSRSLFIDALAAWKFPLEVETLRDLLTREAGEGIPAYASILAYVRALHRDDDRVLEAQVALLLRKDDQDVVLSALRTLDGWGHVLTPAEVKWLLERGGDIRAAALDYLEKHPVN